MKLRPKAEIARFFDGLELVGPGVVPLNRWRPDGVGTDTAEQDLPAYAALGRKP